MAKKFTKEVYVDVLLPLHAARGASTTKVNMKSKPTIQAGY